MTDQSGPGLTERPREEQAPADATDRRSATQGEPRQVWGRIDRLRLLTWAGIAFGIPGVLICVVHQAGGGRSSAFTVRNELPVKAVMVFFVLLATWIVSRIEKRSPDEYGMPLAQTLGWRFWEGTGWGFAMLSAIVLALRALGHFQIDSVALARGAIVQWALAWGLTFLGVSLSEELAFRGYWLFSMARRMRFWPAALFLSAVFGVAHLGNKGENVLGLVQVVATGLLLCLMIRRTGNLWFAIGFHAAWDWAETFFYGTPDSGLRGAGRFLNSSVQGPNWLTGGAAGPEGSVFAFFVLALCALLVHWRFPKAVYPDRPV
ncbi:MAG TPA: CPBP family intramembrane glutamic endopeptidase [Candidatus Sulfotelmatobacter sp.]